VTDHDDATVDDWDGDGELTLPPPADPVGDARRELAEQFVAQARATGLEPGVPRGPVGRYHPPGAGDEPVTMRQRRPLAWMRW
jgi:hypothetical protein